MAEEHGFQPQEGLRLCANNCGFFGSPATMNLCSKCYKDLQLKEESDALAKAAFNHAPPVHAGSSAVNTPAAVAEISLAGDTDVVRAVSTEPAFNRAEPVVIGQQPNRCVMCRKRVGLTGFRCRCGSMYCGSHRYAEQHGCTFDYKKVGKDAIEKANPIIKAEKLEKI